MAQGIARHNFKEPASYLVTAVPVGSLTTWDLVNHTANVVLSGGNLTATASAANQMGSASSSITTGGKVYFEIKLNSPTGGVGMMNPTFNVNTAPYLGGETNAFGYFQNGSLIFNNSTFATVAAYSSGATIGFAIDFNTPQIWLTPDGTIWNNSGLATPVTGTGGINTGGLTGNYLPAFNMDSSDSAIGNFGGPCLD